LSGAAADPTLCVGLVGSPNAGKTTLFNALTGLRAKVANYPGVTVERRQGAAQGLGRSAVVVDLPGTYSLDALSPDEEVVSRVLDGEIDQAPDALVIVADACSLERSMLFVGQVLRRDVPACLALTMIDELHARGGELDIPRLEQALGIPVCGVVGHKGIGLAALRELLREPASWPAFPYAVSWGTRGSASRRCASSCASLRAGRGLRFLHRRTRSPARAGRIRCSPVPSRGARARAPPPNESIASCCTRCGEHSSSPQSW